MNCNRIRMLNVIHFRKLITTSSIVIKCNIKLFSSNIDRIYHTDITVKNTLALFISYSVSILFFIIILYLHYLVILTKNGIHILEFCPLLTWRIEGFLYFLIDFMHSDSTLANRSQNLNFCRLNFKIVRKSFFYQLQNQIFYLVSISPHHEKEVLALLINDQFLSMIHPMCILDNLTFFLLTKNLCQSNNRNQIALNHIPQHIPRSDRRKLIRISNHNQPRMFRNGSKKRPHQKHIYHGHLIDNNHI